VTVSCDGNTQMLSDRHVEMASMAAAAAASRGRMLSARQVQVE
jgi:hypothetical protein